MKRLTITLGLIWLLLPAAPFICAAGTGREAEGGFFTWLFIGLCALIVVLQLLPAARRLLGLAKEVKPHEAATEHQEK